jgi:hypothetical protein
MAIVNLPNTSKGTSDANNFADVYTNDLAIATQVNGNLDNTNVAAGAGISHSKLASMSTGAVLLGNSGTPTSTALSGDVTVGATGVTAIGAGKVTNAMLASSMVGTYRTILTADGYLWKLGPSTALAKTYLLGGTGINVPPDSGMATSATEENALVEAIPPRIIYFAAADHAITGLTTKLRLRAQVASNATASGVTFSFGLFPVTVAGGANALTYTAGTIVSGSIAIIATPSASTVAQTGNTDFTIPSDGAYLLAVVTNATLATNSAVSCHAQLQVRNV